MDALVLSSPALDPGMNIVQRLLFHEILIEAERAEVLAELQRWLEARMR